MAFDNGMLDLETLWECEAILDDIRKAGLTLATAESCTGGLIAAALTSIPGYSGTFLGGFVVYSNAMKTSQLGVPAGVIDAVGAVSEAVARLMAEGALARSGAALAVSCTGVAGPSGGSPGKPVGLVHLAVARGGRSTIHDAPVFPGDRTAVRAATVRRALAILRQAL